MFELKHSFYNIEIETFDTGSVLFFNSITAAFIVMDKETQSLYNNIDSLKCENLSITQQNTIASLAEMGFLVPKTADELSKLKLQSNMNKFMHRKLILTIAPTLDCNMACPYCFEKRQEIKMDEITQNNLCAFSKNAIESRGCTHLHVTWYGGEPLLEIEAIYSLSKRLIQICDEMNVSYTASIITNGVLLTKENAKKLCEECKVITAQITIDGLPEYHNKRRILRDGRKSFDIIINNIEMCKDLLKIYVRTNVDKSNLNNTLALAEYFFNDKKWNTNPYFSVAPVVEYENNFGKSICITESEYGELDSEIMRRRSQLNPEQLKQELYPQRRPVACTAVQYGSYVIDPEGDVYTCLNVIGNKKEAIGNVSDMSQINEAYIKWLLYEPAKECQECKLLPICAGGCPYNFFLHGHPTCDKRVHSFQQRLKIAYHEYLKKKKNVLSKKTKCQLGVINKEFAVGL